MIENIEKEIKYLRSGGIYNDGETRLHCPRCGWMKGQWVHCSLCEGHEENIEEWLRTFAKAVIEKGIDDFYTFADGKYENYTFTELLGKALIEYKRATLANILKGL